MGLKPQSIRKNVYIYINGDLVEKQKVLDLSENWSEKQISFFKKMLKQGGKFKLDSLHYKIILKEQVRRSDGEKDKGVITIPGESSKI